MFAHIGSKITALTRFAFILSSIASIITGLSLALYGYGSPLIGILLIIVGPLVAWLASLFSYAFGEMFENITVIAELMAKADAEKHNQE